MKTKTKNNTAVLTGLWLASFALSASAATLPTTNDIQSGTGYASLDICTRVQQSGDNYSRVVQLYTAPQVQTLPLVWTIDYRPSDKVTVGTILPVPGLGRTAVYRPGLGCTVVTPDTTEATVRAQALHPLTPPAPTAQPWPQGEGSAESGTLSAAQLNILNNYSKKFFTDSVFQTTDKRLNSIAFLVAKNGHLVYERYASGYQRNQAQVSWSMTKSLTALVAGVMSGDNLLRVDDPVGLPQWQGTNKQDITWRQLLNMSSGLEWTESNTGYCDLTRTLFFEGDQGAAVARQPLVATPGTQFKYATGMPTLAMYRMKQLLGNSPQAIYNYYQQRLLLPLGIRNAVIETDASGTPVGGARGVLRPVDWLRLGQLMANDGQWNGTTIIPADYIHFMEQASPAKSSYGGQIWLVKPYLIDKGFPASVISRIPDDTVMFNGLFGQYTMISPSKNLVLVRMGVAIDEQQSSRAMQIAAPAFADLAASL